MDQMVLKAQQWVNSTYGGVSGYVACPENGQTGWSTMHSLTRGLQVELGITALSDAFGPTTMSRMQAYGPVGPATTNTNMKTIVEAALYCKGYNGGAIDGTFGGYTQSGVAQMKGDMGFAYAPSVTPKEMKSLLTMDAYVLIPGGDAQVQAVQRWMNQTYIARADYYIVPCDGYFSRDVQRGLMLAIQYSIGMADGVANGNFGPGTRDGLRTKGTVTVGSTDSGTMHFVRLFKAALVFNQYAGVDWGSTTYTATTSSITTRFQSFCLLPLTGNGDYQTWCSLLVSTGDPDRKGTAADCMTPLNDARAKALVSNGYTTVGRYITGGTQKLLTPSEIGTILANGLRFFPIYQEYNNALSYFDQGQGGTQAEKAQTSALNLGLPRGAVIYFAVDYDATADEVRSNILPYFKGVNDTFSRLGSQYSVGVYGSRNICSMVSERGYAVSSFVSGMSTGFSGNLGFPLPQNWAFDQIKTLTIASGQAGQLEIDNDIMSGRDPGIDSLTKPIDQNAAFITWCVWLEARAQEWRTQGHTDNSTQRLVAMYLRTWYDGAYTGAGFGTVSGDVDQGFIDYCNAAKGRPDPTTLRDPKTGLLCDVQHFGASLGSVLVNSLHETRTEVSLVDFGGWAGDLITAATDVWNAGISEDAAYTYAHGMIGNSAAQGTFGGSDMISDVDAMTVGQAILAAPSTLISDAVRSRYASATAATAKYQEFVTRRFGSRSAMLEAAKNVFDQTSDVPFSSFRAVLWQDKVGVATPIGAAVDMHPALFDGVAQAFVDVLHETYIG